MPSTTYDSLVDELKRLDRLGSIGGILSWDEQVNLPEGSAGLRAEQSAVFSEIYHREAISPKIGAWLEKLEADESLDEAQRVVVEVARRNYDESTKLPADFVRRKALADSRAYHAWTKARANDDFAAFEPFLREQLELCHERAAIMGREADPYDYWIDQFDPGMSQDVIESLFNPLREGLVPLVREIVDSPIKADTSALKGFPEAKQEAFLYEVVKRVGFDFAHGRIDRAIHPFCGGHPQDVRMTTRYHEDNPLDSLSSVIHEMGHGLYEQGLPAEYVGTALGEAAGMAAHESQSRIWENQVGRSRGFWKFWEPRYREFFPAQLKSVDSETLYRAINQVTINPIRVDSDEVTYNLHIMLRFELEKKLVGGQLATKDLPDAWNTLSTELLGYTPKNNREGCLQDVHWSGGMFGYFPSYALGNLLAAQIWETVLSAMPDLEKQFARGEFGGLLSWLRKNVHALGRRYKTNVLAEKVTGSKLSHEPLLRYLRERYLPLFTA